VFATKDIAYGTFIVEYAGELISKKVGDKCECKTPSCFRKSGSSEAAVNIRSC
jgi:hypothetical protein